MLKTKRITRAYSALLSFLKFCLKYSSHPDFGHYSLVENFLQLLIELEDSLRGQFNFHSFGPSYQKLIKILFKEEADEYRAYIDNSKKENLVKKFQLILNIVDFAIEREGEVEVVIIDRELKKIISFLSPFLNEINKKNFI